MLRRRATFASAATCARRLLFATRATTAASSGTGRDTSIPTRTRPASTCPTCPRSWRGRATTSRRRAARRSCGQDPRGNRARRAGVQKLLVLAAAAALVEGSAARADVYVIVTTTRVHVGGILRGTGDGSRLPFYLVP